MDNWDVRSLEIEPRQPQVLRSDPEGRAIVINLPAGEELQEHQVHERTWIFVASGEIELDDSSEGSVTGGPGFLAHADPNVRHEIRAVTDARLVLILIPWPGEGHPSQRSEQQPD
jgi:quercetin dioxygenase-like cupin family protein